MSRAVLEAHVRILQRAYPVSVSTDQRWVLVSRFRLPPAYNAAEMQVLIGVPADYPATPPGIGSGVYVPLGLRYRGRLLGHVHEQVSPGFGRWAWYCFYPTGWNPHMDDLGMLLEVMRADLANPPTR